MDRLPRVEALKLDGVGASHYAARVSKKSVKIAALIDSFRGRDLDAHYLGYFECFNRGMFYEAHDVLEELWLEDRHGPSGDFYKALIQFAGAFVHMQKDCEKYPRLRPASALLELSRGYIKPYAPTHERLDVSRILGLVDEWKGALESGGFAVNPLHSMPPPVLSVGRI